MSDVGRQTFDAEPRHVYHNMESARREWSERQKDIEKALRDRTRRRS